MHKKLFFISRLSFIGGLLLSPLTSFAVQMHTIWPIGYWGGDKGLIECSGVACNALGWCGLVQVFLNFISLGISIAFFVLMPIFLVWGGVVILTSQGNPAKLGEGKKILGGAVVGAVLTLGGYLIVNTFASILGLSVLNIGTYCP